MKKIGIYFTNYDEKLILYYPKYTKNNHDILFVYDFRKHMKCMSGVQLSINNKDICDSCTLWVQDDNEFDTFKSKELIAGIYEHKDKILSYFLKEKDLINQDYRKFLIYCKGI